MTMADKWTWSPAARRAAQAIVNLATDKLVPYRDDMAVLIERETGVGELVEVLDALRAWIESLADGLELDPDETRIRVTANDGPGCRKVLAERSLTSVLDAARTALAKHRGAEAP
jgi:hypothetical protein